MTESCCPTCAGPVPEGAVWIYNGKFYCSEGCVRKAAEG